MSLAHHDLCFGCGLANVFGLQLNVERREDGSVEGRFFAKQDHQGRPGFVHEGVLAVALAEAAQLAAAGSEPTAISRLELEVNDAAAIGTFVRVATEVAERNDGATIVLARAYADDGEGPVLAEARASVVPAR